MLRKLRSVITLEKTSHLLVTKKEMQAIIKDLPTNIATGSKIPVNILKKPGFCFGELTNPVNHTLIIGKLSVTLKKSKCYTCT